MAAGVASARSVDAQVIIVTPVSEDEFAAWAAMMLTPVGAFPALMVSPGGNGAQRVPAWAFRGSAWKFEGGDRNYNVGVSYIAPVATKAIFTGTLGVYAPGGDNADNGLLLGGDLANIIRRGEWLSNSAASMQNG